MERAYLLLSVFSIGSLGAKDVSLLDVSFDPKRELYAEYDRALAKSWKEKTGSTVTVDQSYGGSGRQARGSTVTFTQRGIGDVVLAWKDPNEETIVYCRIGEHSSQTWFVLTYLLGFPRVKNYDGSWAEWGNSVRVPIEKGS
jgi:ABC-type sulfate transport system substrate-binding protein